MSENPPPAEDHDPEGEHQPASTDGEDGGPEHEHEKSVGDSGAKPMSGYQLGHRRVVDDPVSGTSRYEDDPAIGDGKEDTPK